jgi:DMSO reductase anchor subunit
LFLGAFAAAGAGVADLKPAWPVILHTTLIGSGQGLFLVAFGLDASRRTPRDFVLLCCAIVLLLLGGGLAAFFVYLGGPARARRAAFRWRTSWLARGVVVLPACMAMVVLYGLLRLLDGERPFILVAGTAAALLCIVLFACTGMTYAGLRFLREWRSPLTMVNFVLLGCASGLTLAVPLAVLAWPQFAGPLSLGAFCAGAAAWLACGASLLRNVRLQQRPRGRPDLPLHASRWMVLALLFPLPGWLLGWGGGSLVIYVGAFLLQFAGLLAERWHFFAAARA